MLGWSIVITLILYLGALFFVAYKIDTSPRLSKKLFNSPTKYALSLAVYCTAWTFFGSVGAASTYSLEFLTIYLGPIVMMPLLWVFYRKFIRISKSQGISSLSDFISIRYNKSFSINQLVTVLLVMGIIPYIALQITGIEKAIETCVNWGEGRGASIQKDAIFNTPFFDIAFLITVGLGLFIVLFTTRRFQNKEQNTGVMGAIALESIVKLVVFIIFGIYVSYFIFDGQSDLYARIPEGSLKINAQNDYSEWVGMIFLSGIAFLFLPRQFEVGVIEVSNEKQLKKAIWLLPVYLVLINLFVIPIAIAGNELFASSTIDADTYMLAIPLQLNNPWMALLVLLGGFSAASGMIIVATHALSKMVSNSILMPYFIDSPFILKRFKGENHRIPVFFRRISIFIVLLFAYSYYKFIVSDFSLISIGLISFLAVAQFAPTVLGSIFWKYGTRFGAVSGIVSGFTCWFIFLVLPTFLPEEISVSSLNLIQNSNSLDEGALITRVLFWSLLINTLLYVVVSIFTKQTSLERNQAEIYVDIFNYSTTIESSVVWKGKAFFPDIQSLLSRFLGERKAAIELSNFVKTMHISIDDKTELDPRIVNHAERLLSGFVGSSSARILVGSVVKEEKISMTDVVDILEESQKLISVNKALKQKSEELKRATDALIAVNSKLKENDLLKDEFLYTVTHEMRTPLTSIKALSEILADDDDVEEETRKEFLKTIVKESERMTRLISQVLDLENFESGKHQLSIDKVNVIELLQHCVQTQEEVFKQQHIIFHCDLQKSLPETWLDYDRITQVVLNLLANAANYCDKTHGEIWLTAYQLENQIKINVSDNGNGVKKELENIIFEKFFQAKNQTIRKPKGSGLGLAISKKIIQLHEGKIWVEANEPKGSRFSFTIPIQQHF
jgi:signal transduction histidine kinase